MPAPTTVPEFLELLRKSGLVPDPVLNDFVDRLPGAPREEVPVGEVVGAMTRSGLLSPFQVRQLLEGRWRGFTIGKFKIVERLGGGGQGNVLLCEHRLTRQRMAVKVLRRINADDPTAVKRFYREAQAAAALSHPNIVRAYDVGEDEGQHYLVMDYIEGTDLRQIVQRDGSLSVPVAVNYVRQAALGLQYAHECGFVHRDIKPGNLLLDKNGTVRILDMGLARGFEEADILTQGTDILGSADYLAPEQARDSHNVDIRADIYALGSTLYFLLTGIGPFEEIKTVSQKLLAKQLRMPRNVRDLRPNVPEPLAAVIERMLDTDPEDRYATPIDVANALEPFVATSAPVEAPKTVPARVPARSPDSRPPFPLPVKPARGANDTPSPFVPKPNPPRVKPLTKVRAIPAGKAETAPRPPAAPPRVIPPVPRKAPEPAGTLPRRIKRPAKSPAPLDNTWSTIRVVASAAVLVAAGLAIGVGLSWLVMNFAR